MKNRQITSNARVPIATAIYASSDLLMGCSAVPPAQWLRLWAYADSSGGQGSGRKDHQDCKLVSDYRNGWIVTIAAAVQDHFQPDASFIISWQSETADIAISSAGSQARLE